MYSFSTRRFHFLPAQARGPLRRGAQGGGLARLPQRPALVVVLVLLVVVATSSKSLSCVVANRIEIKFGRNVLHANTHRLTVGVTESDFDNDVIISRWQS